MEIKIKLTSEDGQSEIIVFAHSGNSDLSMNKTQHQCTVVEKCLAQILDCEVVEVGHHPSGAPFLPAFKEHRISISHSENLYAIQLSQTKNVGIDVQVIKKDLFEGRSYFVNDDEEKNLNLTNENLYLIWSAKEAVYKLKKGEIKKYKEGMTVLEIGSTSLVVRVDDEVINCSFSIQEDFLVLYTD